MKFPLTRDPDTTVPSTEKRPPLLLPNDPQFWEEMLYTLQSIRRNTERGTKADGWETNGPTVAAIVGTATSRAVLAITTWMQVGFYELRWILTNPEPGAFNYELAYTTSEVDPTSTVISDSASSRVAAKSQRFIVPGVSTISGQGFVAIRGETRARLILRILAPTTVVGHSGSLFLQSLR